MVKESRENDFNNEVEVKEDVQWLYSKLLSWNAWNSRHFI
jgi:hypothetical protein